MTAFISVKNNKNEFVHHKVPLEIAIYIRQLEFAIKNPDESKIKKLYPERFNVK